MLADRRWRAVGMIGAGQVWPIASVWSGAAWHRTTIPGKVARRAPDLLGRDFTAAAPNGKWVTDFTYTRTWSGFVYVAFVVYCYSRGIWAGTRPP